MMPNSLKIEAEAAIAEAAGTAPAMIDFRMECVIRLAADAGLSVEKISDVLWVARDQEEDGQKFDFWMFCKFGDSHTGQTVCGFVLK